MYYIIEYAILLYSFKSKIDICVNILLTILLIYFAFLKSFLLDFFEFCITLQNLFLLCFLNILFFFIARLNIFCLIN